MKGVKDMIHLVEFFLMEFCEVNGVDENDLKDHVYVFACAGDNSLMVLNVDDERDVKFGVKEVITNLEGKFSVSFSVFGEYECKRDNYPKTTELISRINNEADNDAA